MIEETRQGGTRYRISISRGGGGSSFRACLEKLSDSKQSAAAPLESGLGAGSLPDGLGAGAVTCYSIAFFELQLLGYNAQSSGRSVRQRHC